MRRMKGGTKDGWRRDVGGMKEGLSERLMEEGGMKEDEETTVEEGGREEKHRGRGVGGSGFDWLIEKKKEGGEKKNKVTEKKPKCRQIRATD